MRHKDLRVYFFDRHRGVEIFCNAINGSYIKFDGEEGDDIVTMNPFSCADVPENRAFLRRWMTFSSVCFFLISASESRLNRDRVRKNSF